MLGEEQQGINDFKWMKVGTIFNELNVVEINLR
jgi:hypothetical protein